MHVCRIHGMTLHQIIDLAHHVVPPLRSITKEMDDLFNQVVDHTTSFYILPYYLANTPPLRDNASPPLIVLMKTTVQVLLSVKTLTVTSNLCDVYKILYYAAV